MDTNATRVRSDSLSSASRIRLDGARIFGALRQFLVFVAAAAWTVAALQGAICVVPADHPTIQEAVDDSACTSLELTGASHDETIRVTRSLSLTGIAAEPSTIAGGVVVAGSGVVLTTSRIEVENGCAPMALETTGGARVESADLQVRFVPGGPCPAVVDANILFSDGFESGSTSAW